MSIAPSPELLAGPWENASVTKVTEDVALLNTLDFFTPIVDEPEIQGRIAASNVTSDIYAMAVTNIANMLSIMAFPENMPNDIAIGMLKGFADFCREIDAPLLGGHTIRNPWPIMGGAATGLGNPKKIVYTHGAKPGDRLVLTKPLGVQPAMAAYRMRKEEGGQEFLQEIPEDLVDEAISGAIKLMTTSNKSVAEVMQQVPVHAATDVTGFGLKGHAENMAKLSVVDIIFDSLPVLRGTPALADLMGYSLLDGEASETAGGMLIAISREALDGLLDRLESQKVRYFEVGSVVEGSGIVKIAKNVKIVET